MTAEPQGGLPKTASPSGMDAAGSSAEEADAACVREVLAGRRERFEELVRRYQRVVYGVVLAYVREPHLAEDVAQEVFVSAFTALGQLREPGRFLPWLLQIARHRAGREYKKTALRAEQPLEGRSEPARPESGEDAARAAGVLALVEELPEPYRETLLRKYQMGLSCKEIARLEAVPIGTITSRLTRALAVLRSALVQKT